MEQLETYAAIAEICGALTIVGGGIFALIQVLEFRKIRQYRAAADLSHQFASPEMARAFKLVRQLPDNVTMAQLETLGPEYEDAILIVGMFLETMGLQVFQRVASYQTVHELAGGVVSMVWRKIGVWLVEWREFDGQPDFGEWFQWLAERFEESKGENEPAYLAYANWNKKRS